MSEQSIEQSDLKFDFPLLTEVSINDFSLYKKADMIDLAFDKEVFCLAGANGLGKSTFLTIINYGLTGIVINPEKNFKSIVSTVKFYNNNKGFPKQYFDGRVEEEDRERASVTLNFQVGGASYSITRSFFESEELLDYERLVNGEDTVQKGLDESHLFKLYCENVVEDIGLATFDQFVFLQHFVFTFDEHHHLLFWDKTLMETSLYLFFGVNVEDAYKANSLRKRINELGSNIRNFTYQKNRTKKDVQELEGKIEEIQSKVKLKAGILEDYDQLIRDYEEFEVANEKLKHDLRFCELNISDFSIKMAELRSQYQSVFNDLMNPPVDILEDQNVRDLVKELKKEFCSGGEGTETLEKLKQYVLANICLPDTTDESDLSKQLKEIDSQIAHLKSEIDNAQSKKERLGKERIELEKNQLIRQNHIVEFEKEQGEFIIQLRHDAKGDHTGILKSYYEQISKREKEIEEKRSQKTEAEKELRKLERVLNRNFASAQEKFMPIFQGYVSEFLGLDVNTKLKNSSEGTTLVLEINNAERTDVHQLSESQRYFVDIGLRMALIQYGCQNAMLLIDTPEGSLDIAYESKAGKMFAEFAQTQYKLLMTANINTSQLLIELAQKCKSEGMRLERMTEWTFLSEVQQQEQSKIEEAFDSIEKSLSST